MKVNLGCGADYREGWINVDINPPCDIICNIDQEELPFELGSVEHVTMFHVLEHIHNLRRLKKELVRVIAPGGLLEVLVPHYLSPDAWGDDTHCRAFSDQSFLRDFWPGFRVQELRHEKKINANGEEVTWIYVQLRRTYELYKSLKESVYFGVFKTLSRMGDAAISANGNRKSQG